VGSHEGQRPHERPGHTAKKLRRAAVDCAQNEGNPPPELELYWYCKRFPGALPNPGALLDQDAKTMYRMAALDSIYSAVTRLRNMYGAKIHQLTNSERVIIRSLIDEGLL